MLEQGALPELWNETPIRPVSLDFISLEWASESVVALFSKELLSIISFLNDWINEATRYWDFELRNDTEQMVIKKIKNMSVRESKYLLSHLKIIEQNHNIAGLKQSLKEFQNWCISSINSKKHV